MRASRPIPALPSYPFIHNRYIYLYLSLNMGVIIHIMCEWGFTMQFRGSNDIIAFYSTGFRRKSSRTMAVFWRLDMVCDR
jgi:hypothetical protein